MYARNYTESRKLVFLGWVEDWAGVKIGMFLAEFNAINLLTTFLSQKCYVIGETEQKKANIVNVKCLHICPFLNLF